MTRLLQRTHHLALEFLDGLDTRPVASPADFATLVARAGGPLPAQGEDPIEVIERLAGSIDAGLVATPGPRYFGFVIGGAVPAAVAADWLGAVWDQNGFSYASSPASAAVEDIAARWLTELFGLPAGVSVGFTTGCTMANFTGLAAVWYALLGRLGLGMWKRRACGARPLLP